MPDEPTTEHPRQWLHDLATKLGAPVAWVEGRLLPALDDLGYRITRIPNPLLDKRGNYYGKQGTTHEHRTVGDYRAWSYDASEWCYPSDPCRLCREMADA